MNVTDRQVIKFTAFRLRRKVSRIYDPSHNHQMHKSQRRDDGKDTAPDCKRRHSSLQLGYLAVCAGEIRYHLQLMKVDS